MSNVECKMQCGFNNKSESDCEFCKHNTRRKIIGDEEAWEKWHERALKMLMTEPSPRQAFRAGWILKKVKK
jgi:hypothetical protein